MIGSFGGMMGSMFIIINNKINILRKVYLNTKLKKILESCILVTLITSTFFLISYFKKDCMPGDDKSEFMVKSNITKQFLCEEGEYNQIGSLFFNT